MKVIIAASQTGGHVNPGIAIANKIKKENKDARILFIGTTRGIENDLVPRAGYELKTIQAYGLNRNLSISNTKNIIKTLRGFKQSKKIVKEFNPDIVIGTGGFICGPTILAAHRYKIPTILHESNAFPGIAVKFLANKTSTILLGFKEAKERLPKAKNLVVTGTPTKIKDVTLSEQEIKNIKKELKLDTDLPTILIFGGSQGAKSINNTLIEAIKNEPLYNYQIIWASGSAQYELIKEELNKSNIDIQNIENIKIVPYIYNMEEIMRISDIIISRSGAMTITEIAKIGKPAIFIPFPFATENHQEYNAKVLENIGAAKIILDKDLNWNILSNTLNDMLRNNAELIKMGEKAKTVSINNVEERIYEEIMKLIKRSN